MMRLMKPVGFTAAENTYAVDTSTTTGHRVRDKIATRGVIATVVAVEDHEKGVHWLGR
jgi:hypothetical protein